jgi:hypothetical protein
MARQKNRTHARRAADDAAKMIEETAAQAGHAADAAQNTVIEAGERMQEAMRRGFAAGSRPFGALSEKAFEAWLRSSNETLQRMLELNVELASWGREQLDESIGAVRSLSQCRSFGDACGVQLGLMRSSMENSLRHANKVLSLTANVMTAAAPGAQPSRPD